MPEEEPAFRRIAAELREQIRTGFYRPGAPLPSVRRLQERHGVSAMTVRQAVQQLRAEGLVTVERGAGVFVREEPRLIRVSGPERFRRADRQAGRGAFAAEMERLRKRWDIEQLAVERVPASSEIANRLGLDESTPVVRRRRVYLVEGAPHQIATTYIPLALAEGTAIEQENTGPGGVYQRLEEAGRRIATFEEEISGRMPGPEERAALRIPEGVPLFRVFRSALAADGAVLEVTESLYPCDRVVLAYPWPAD